MSRLRRIWTTLGPGILLAATSIGASHLVLSPRAGLLYGPVLLWLLVAAHLFKYPAFEFGPRYALATGESLLAGYTRVPGPRNWALILFAVFTALQGVGVAVAVTSISAAVLTVSIGGLSLAGWGVVVATVALILIAVGRFPAMEVANKIMMLVLALVTVVTFLARPPAVGSWAHLVIPELPGGAIVLVAAIVGWLPTGIDVSVWHSLWALEVQERWQSGAGDARKEQLRRGLLDMRIGYGLSFTLAILFLFLGTQIPRVAGAAPDGARVAVAISEAYGAILGQWIVPVFLVAAFFGMFSTTYIVMDGFPRALAEAMRLLSPSRRESKEFWATPYWALLCVVWIGVVLILLLWPKPIFLITTAALMSLLVSPLYYALNTWCVSRCVEDPDLRGPLWLRVLAMTGIAFVTIAVALWVYVKFFR